MQPNAKQRTLRPEHHGKEGAPNYDISLKQTTEAFLIDELELLRNRFGVSEQLQVLWVPGKRAVSEIDHERLLHGETVGDTIYIYDESESEALETLRHEVLEHFVVDQNESDYVTLINHLIEAFNIVHRRRREELVAKLSELV
ncbi:MAG: hypothetical protein ABSF63_00140 [Candidatus Bathyarchaeia archaeon]|jgi:hypothetical protein